MLVITEVLKGKCSEKEIPIIIHYGLTPSEDGRGHRGKVKGLIEIIDTGRCSHMGMPLVKDAKKNNLWFLRKRSGTYGRKPGKGKYGIVDPEDLQPLEWKDYFRAYLADNPENAVREYARKQPGKAGRAKRYFDHLDIQRILKIKDPAKRYDKLLPFFLSRTSWNMKREARDGVIACGKIAGRRLKKIFDGPRRAISRSNIIMMWRDMRYVEVAPMLIDLLEKHDRYWATQKLKKGWWSNGTNPELTQQRHNIYGEVFYSVCALRAFGDPRARSIIEATRNRWKAKNFDNTQIVEECDAALRKLSKKTAAAQQGAATDAAEASKQ